MIGAGGKSAITFLLACFTANSAMAKDMPASGSWRIEPKAMTEPLNFKVGSRMRPVLRQRLVPEAAVLTDTAVNAGAVSLPAASALIRVTTKQGTAWCAMEPLRVHPGEPKTSFGESLLFGRKMVDRRETPCFADSNGDGLMDQVMTGTERGYVLPTINKLGKPVSIAPFAVRQTEAADVVSYPLELQAELVTPKNRPPHLIFALTVSSGGNSSQIEGFDLVESDTGSVSFATFAGLASIKAEFSDAVAAKVTLGDLGADGTAEVRVENGMEAHNFGLGNISLY